MRIAQLSYNHDPDLREPEALLARYNTMTGWADALSQAGALVTVYQRFPVASVISRHGVTYRFEPSPTDALLQSKSMPDIAHIHGLIFSTEGWKLRQKLPATTAIVLQNHGSLPETKGGLLAPLRRFMKQKTLNAADAVLFAAVEQGAAWKAAGFIDETTRPYAVMPASSDFHEQPREWARTDSGISGQPAILWVGRLNANKDPLTVIEAFDRLLASQPRATLTMIYTEATLLPQVEARLAQKDALKAQVRLVGEVRHDRLPSFYSAADLFVVGSHYEGSGFSLIEALACGLTPVVTSIPSFQAICGDGIGALWKPGDAVGCARALLNASTRVDARQRDVVRRHFERTLSWRVIGERAMAVYIEVAGRRKGAHKVIN